PPWRAARERSSCRPRSPVAPKNTRASEAEFPIANLLLYRGWPMPWHRDSHTGDRLLQVSAEPVAHRRQEPSLVIRLAARAESLVERGGENRHRDGLVDSGLDRPPSFSRIRDLSSEL